MTGPLTISRAQLMLGETRGATPEYVTHQLVSDMFGDVDARDFLFRVTTDGGRSRNVLILSAGLPCTASRIPVRQYGTVGAVESKPFAPKLRSGLVLDYEILVNATVSVGKKRTDVWDAVFAANRDDPQSMHDVYRAYLERRWEGAASVLSARVTARGLTVVRRAGMRRGAPMTYVTANVIGTLQVVDPDRLLAIVSQGTGRAKGFGCGLVCLSRPGSVLPRQNAASML